MKKKSKETLSSRVFHKIFVTGSLTAFTLIGAGFIDSLIISRFFGIQAIAAAGLAYPFYFMAGIVHGCIGTGYKSVAAQKLVCGDMEGYRRIYSICIMLSVVISFVAMVLLLFFAEPVAFIFGARGQSADLLDLTKEYVIGLSFGFPALVLNTVLSTALQFDNGIRNVQMAHIITMISDIVLDLVVVWMGAGMLGMGLASSISAYIGLLVICMHFASGKSSLKLTPVKPEMSELRELVHLGSDRILSRTLNVIRPLIINPLLIYIGGSSAMAVLSVRNSLIRFAAIPGYGISDGVSVSADIAYNLRSRDELIETGVYAHRYSFIYQLVPGILICMFSGPISAFYLPDGSPEVRSLLIFALCMGGLKLLFETQLTARVSFLQATRSISNAKRLLFQVDFASVILCVIVFGHLFGAYGVMAAFTISDMLAMLLVYIFYALQVKDFRVSIDDYLNIEDERYVSPADVLELDLRTEEECSLAGEQVAMFCRGHKADHDHSAAAGMCTAKISTTLFRIVSDVEADPAAPDGKLKLHMTYSEGQARIHFRFYCRDINIASEIEQLQNRNNRNGVDAELNKSIKDIRVYRSMDIENVMITV